MIKLTARLGLLIPVILILFSCDDDFDLNLNAPGVNQLNAIYTDTVTVAISTHKLDTVNTTNQMLIGSVQDPFFGTTRSMAYTTLMLGKDTLNFAAPSSSFLALDSVVLTLGVTNFYGDTTQENRLLVHRLLQKPDSGKQYYSTDELHVSELLGEAMLKGSRNRVVRIKMNERFSRELFSRSGEPEFLNQANFERYLPGLRISAEGPANGSMITVDPKLDNSRLVLYYRNSALDTVSRQHSFFLLRVGINPFNSNEIFIINGRTFSNIKTDLGQSRFLRTLSPAQALPSNQTGNVAHLQGAAGIYVRLQFPHLKNISEGRRVLVNKAFLSFHNASENYDPSIRFNQPPPNILLYLFSNPDGLPARQSNGLEAFLAAEGRATRAEAFYRAAGRNYPDLEVTSMIQDILSGRTANNGILIRALNPGGTINKLLIADQQYAVPAQRIQLKIHYTIIPN
jgi:hypothetical protein